jgi:hypothetical protein
MQPPNAGDIMHTTSYMEEVFVAAGTGDAVLTAPAAFNPSFPDSPLGPRQRFIVRDAPAWTCSATGGCATVGPAANNTARPDRYYPIGVTPP